MPNRMKSDDTVVPVIPMAREKTYRTIWISDVHLGARGSSAKKLLDFLKDAECDKMYIVGDFIDVWQLKRSRHWPQDHNDVVQKMLIIAPCTAGTCERFTLSRRVFLSTSLISNSPT